MKLSDVLKLINALQNVLKNLFVKGMQKISLKIETIIFERIQFCLNRIKKEAIDNKTYLYLWFNNFRNNDNI